MIPNSPWTTFDLLREGRAGEETKFRKFRGENFNRRDLQLVTRSNFSTFTRAFDLIKAEASLFNVRQPHSVWCSGETDAVEGVALAMRKVGAKGRTGRQLALL